MRRRPRMRDVAAVLLAGGTFTVLALWMQASAHHPPPVDMAVHQWLLDHRVPSTVSMARWTTWGGESVVALPLVAAVGAWTGGPQLARRGRRAALLTAALAVGLMARIGIAHAVARSRPPRGDWAGGAGGFAFPSGHTTAATVAAGLIAWAVLRRHRNADAGPAPTSARRRWVVIGAAALAAALVGWSRVWLGVHWPLDVVGAWLLGVAWLALCGIVFAFLAETVTTRAATPEVVTR